MTLFKIFIFIFTFLDRSNYMSFEMAFKKIQETKKKDQEKENFINFKNSLPESIRNKFNEMDLENKKYFMDKIEKLGSENSKIFLENKNFIEFFLKSQSIDFKTMKFQKDFQKIKIFFELIDKMKFENIIEILNSKNMTYIYDIKPESFQIFKNILDNSNPRLTEKEIVDIFKTRYSLTLLNKNVYNDPKNNFEKSKLIEKLLKNQSPENIKSFLINDEIFRFFTIEYNGISSAKNIINFSKLIEGLNLEETIKLMEKDPKFFTVAIDDIDFKEEKDFLKKNLEERLKFIENFNNLESYKRKIYSYLTENNYKEFKNLTTDERFEYLKSIENPEPFEYIKNYKYKEFISKLKNLNFKQQLDFFDIFKKKFGYTEDIQAIENFYNEIPYDTNEQIKFIENEKKVIEETKIKNIDSKIKKEFEDKFKADKSLEELQEQKESLENEMYKKNLESINQEKINEFYKKSIELNEKEYIENIRSPIENQKIKFNIKEKQEKREQERQEKADEEAKKQEQENIKNAREKALTKNLNFNEKKFYNSFSPVKKEQFLNLSEAERNNFFEGIKNHNNAIPDELINLTKNMNIYETKDIINMDIFKKNDSFLEILNIIENKKLNFNQIKFIINEGYVFYNKIGFHNFNEFEGIIRNQKINFEEIKILIENEKSIEFFSNYHPSELKNFKLLINNLDFKNILKLIEKTSENKNFFHKFLRNDLFIENLSLDEKSKYIKDILDNKYENILDELKKLESINQQKNNTGAKSQKFEFFKKGLKYATEKPGRIATFSLGTVGVIGGVYYLFDKYTGKPKRELTKEEINVVKNEEKVESNKKETSGLNPKPSSNWSKKDKSLAVAAGLGLAGIAGGAYDWYKQSQKNDYKGFRDYSKKLYSRMRNQVKKIFG